MTVHVCNNNNVIIPEFCFVVTLATNIPTSSKLTFSDSYLSVRSTLNFKLKSICVSVGALLNYQGI